jgi:hypothetical protein
LACGATRPRWSNKHFKLLEFKLIWLKSSLAPIKSLNYVVMLVISFNYSF